MRNRVYASSASLFALITALGAPPALAQTAPAAPQQAAPAPADNSSGAGIGDIVVTAQKRAENVQNVPIAISAVSSQFLQSRDISSIDRLGSIAPNVKIERAPSNKTISQISIRGSVTINPAITWEPAVGLYLDGVYIAKAQGSIFDVADLERVELLRGPQGTLYGRNALAGAVNLITKKPSGEWGGSAEITYGNYNFWRGKAVLDLPKIGIFSVKLSGTIQRRDGFIKLVPNPYPQAFLAGKNPTDRTNDLQSESFMAQVRAQPAHNLTFDYSFDYSRYHQRPDYAQLYRVNRNGDPRDIFDPNSPSYGFVGAFFPLNLYTNQTRQSTASLDANPLYERTRTEGHSLTATWDVGAQTTIKSITGFRRLRFDDNLDLDGSPLPVAATGRRTRYHAFSQELQVTGKAFEDRLNYVAGLYYFKDFAETLGPQSFFGGATAFESDYASHTEAYAAYAQADLKIVDKVTLTGGIRYTHERKDIRRLLIAQPNTPQATTLINVPFGGVPDAKFHDFSPAVTLKYEPTDHINLYARYAKGFKSGGFNGETNIVGTTASLPGCAAPAELTCPYKAETVNSYEVGIKTKLLNNTLQFNVAGFLDDHKNIQLSIFTAEGAAASIVRNAAAARISGLEIEAIARPADWLTFNTSFAYLHAKYKNYIDYIDGIATDVSNNRAFPHAPKYTVSMGADWRVAQGDWGKFNLIADMNFVSSYYTFPYALVTASPSDQNANNTKSPGRTIVNMRASLGDIQLAGTKAEISLWVRNLTNERNPQNFIDFGPGFGGLTVAYFPDPRTFGVTAGVKF
ncbi:TonB-dependent receptor [Sphingomonas lycopersici]|uniref:TonB-dependent receptor n=1 Tax=Sphingomonas lycopersici TaxID=2951807 RepID=A0AA41Z8C7_9SPHN|nr:TonB-dependent receptor [Sphingomonas lycopersici]MCW6534773.1 TonB-dependent receptor [Sphingomonas lycopersici]